MSGWSGGYLRPALVFVVMRKSIAARAALDLIDAEDLVASPMPFYAQ